MSIRLLDIVKPFVSILPELEFPYEKLGFDDKILYTVGPAALYMLSSLPINGVNPAKLADPFGWLRIPFASQQGTLLEFGLLPIITAGLFWQFLAGSKLIKVNFEARSDRELFQSLQKFTTYILALVYSTVLVFAGYFEPIDSVASDSTVSIWTNLLIIAQLTGFSIISSLMIEVMDKGYGFGPGISAIIALSASAKFAQSAIGPTSYVTSRGYESDGAIVQTVRNFFSKSFGLAVVESFTRADGANLIQVYVALIAIAISVYLSNIRLDVPIKSSKVRSMASVYPVKLIYCGALPLLFTYAVLYNANIFGFALTKICNTCPQISLIGKWELDAFTKQSYNLVGGLLYFISSSSSSKCLIGSLIRPFTYGAFVVGISTLFSSKWINYSGSSGRDLAKQFKEQDISMLGHRDATKELNRIIPTAAIIGAVITSSLVAVTENLCSTGLCVGSIVGIFSALTVLESVMTEWQQTGGVGSQLSAVFNP
ncbi:hypothetical protein B5S28_g2185 [[Candida] boidinii]|nr:hypothetical protein B5S28_g2185 [[Candida] boidinii]OWB63059.1 hypothetical protein B5S29_g4013 [[Candida] boidinii]OWB73895.1 hypothetical protein B5S31_g3662 [[Candida] boidinii]OWB79819.1 hypothetical protein B5S32_g4056 [[Candida] boidinii]